MRFIGSSIDRDVYTSLLSYLPKYYKTGKTVTEIMRVDALELEQLYSSIDDTFNQYFLDNATWGLDYWEKELGITTDISKTDDERRGVIMSSLRGYGTSTIEFIKNVSESYINGEVDIAEDAPNYTINVTFVGKHGIPSNMTDIQNTLRNVTPAHLAINYIYTYLVWQNLSGAKTFDTLSTYTWTQLEDSF